MKELELMGRNPIDIMFGSGEVTIEEIEDTYIAFTRAKAKYPKWYGVVGEWVGKRIYRD
jgi:hypothetical protein